MTLKRTESRSNLFPVRYYRSIMNRILQFFKILCVNNSEMVNKNQFSPRVTRSKSKKQQQQQQQQQQQKQKTDDDGTKKKSRTEEKPKGSRKNKVGKEKEGEGEEGNSLRASRGSLGSVSLLKTPDGSSRRPDTASSRPKSLSPANGKPLPDEIFLKSPPIGTISADTPERSALHFRREIENVSECRLRIVGKGSFGTIIQATYKGELVAAKIVPPHKSKSLKNELNNFLLSHPNIVKTLRIIANDENNSCGLVIMEMCSSFTLEHLANEKSNVLDEKKVVRFMIDIGRALEHCHDQKVLHLDVKPQNILVNVNLNICKLCDFGSSCLLMDDEMAAEDSDHKALQSTVVYTSPELLTGRQPTGKSDVYSFGITLWQLLHRKKPYVVDEKIDLQSTIYQIVKQRKRPQKRTKEGGILENLYFKCWEHEPDKRPTMNEIIHCLENIYMQ